MLSIQYQFNFRLESEKTIQILHLFIPSYKAVYKEQLIYLDIY
jgi:hypothetical protein